jgi:hypothetical protein
VSKNHHPKSISTSPQFFAVLFFDPTGAGATAGEINDNFKSKSFAAYGDS